MEPKGKLEEDSYFPPLLEQEPNRQTVLMDFDLDLDTAWPMDQIFALANPSSSFLQSNAEHSYSPLWAFSGDNNDNNNSNNGADFVISGGAFRLSDCSRILSSDGDPPDVQPDSAFVNDDKRKIPSSLPGFMHNQDKSFLIKERMSQALRYFKDLSEQHVLAQVWAPVKNGGKYVLTTTGQPFLLDPNSNGLYQYRLVSLRYMFSVDGNTDVLPGLPGRVFQQKLPEWTPNVQYYSSKEFPRLNHALNYNVQGTLALPVFEPSGQSCIGVLELIMTSQKINYAPEVDKVCKALEAVNLKSSEILDLPSTQICTESRQNALAEILEIITVVCETHTLPLAQTWVPCRHRNVLANGGGFKKICSSFDGSCMGQVCMSTTDVAFYVVDAHLWGFREACAEHHLQKGQGVAGRAFSSHNSCFCADITKFCKTEYPLVHYARMFGLRSSFAICLRSNHTGNDDYVLEFFLPSNIENYGDQQILLDSVLVTMKKHFGGLHVASGKDLDQEWRTIEVINGSTNEKHNLSPDFASTYPILPLPVPTREIVHLDFVEELNEFTGGDIKINADTTTEFHNAVTITEANGVGKKTGKKRGKAEKTISLEVLQQYFAGSLKDAAKSLGVCPTTMKRICRQHGISRWPSRKINKVNRSLSKLQRVIESVQGGEGTFSLKPNSVPITVGSISWAANTSGTNKKNSPESIPSEYEEKKEVTIAGTEILIPQENGFLPAEVSSRSRSRSVSKEESLGTPTSQGSCQGSFKNENENKVASQQGIEATPPSAPILIPDNFMTTPLEPFGGLLVEDAGSSHDLRNLCPPGESMFDEHVTEYSWTKAPLPKPPMAALAEPGPQFASTTQVKNSITVKVTYREDIIRFRLTADSGIFKLREEIAKRLKLEVGTFDIKYFDDDQEWVLIACDTDLQECVDISASSGSSIVRLLVHDIMANLGSSCESSGD